MNQCEKVSHAFSSVLGRVLSTLSAFLQTNGIDSIIILEVKTLSFSE